MINRANQGGTRFRQSVQDLPVKVTKVMKAAATPEDRRTSWLLISHCCSKGLIGRILKFPVGLSGLPVDIQLAEPAAPEDSQASHPIAVVTIGTLTHPRNQPPILHSQGGVDCIGDPVVMAWRFQ